MKKRWFLVGVILLLSLLVVSCGVSQDYHDTVVDERNALQAQVTSLQKDLDKAKSDLGAAQGQIKTLQGDYETANAELVEIKKMWDPETDELIDFSYEVGLSSVR